MDIPEDQCLDWLGGFFNFHSTGMRWKDYLGNFQEEVRPYLEAVRESIVDGQLRLTGQDHQLNSVGMPVFSDGKCLALSYRAWGDLMAAVWSEAENKDYNYMDFYM